MFTGAWSPDGGLIVVSSGNPVRLYKVDASGGKAELLIEPAESEPGRSPSFPRFLTTETGRQMLLYLTGAANESQIVVQDLETGDSEVIANAGPFAYSPSGHILYQPSRDDASILFALPFSTDTLKPTGEAFSIAEHAAFPSVAADGTLVYLGVDSPGAEQLVWRDRGGARLGTVGDPHQEIRAPALSPDGGRVLIRARDATNWDIWALDTTSGLRTRLTFEQHNEDRPIWYPSGNTITFTSNSSGNSDLYLTSADGSGEAQHLRATEMAEYGINWSADGAYLVCVFMAPGSPGDVWYLRREEGKDGYEALPFIKTEFDELEPVFSPDGRFVAYSSTETGHYEIYVGTFPEGGGRWQVSHRSRRCPI